MGMLRHGLQGLPPEFLIQRIWDVPENLMTIEVIMRLLVRKHALGTTSRSFRFSRSGPPGIPMKKLDVSLNLL